MIVFDLRCGAAHVFEAWFGSTADFERQRGAGLVACPLCGDSDIGKAVMAPAVAAKGNARGAPPRDGHGAPPRDGRGAPPRDGRGALLAAQRRLEASADYVGSDFAARARALHAEPAAAADTVRSIYGEASLGEAAALIDDGIPVLPLAFRPLVRFDA